MNPYAILGAIAVLIATHGATAWWFYDAGQDSVTAQQAKTDDKAQKGAGNAVAQAKAESVKVVTRVKTVTRDVPVYRDAQCSHTDGVFHDLNGALRGAGDGGVPSGSGGAARQDDGRDDGKAD